MSGYLDKNGYLKSNFWLDQVDACEALRNRLSSGAIEPELYEALTLFTQQGYVKLSLDGFDDLIESFNEDVERAWRDLPYEVVISPLSGERTSLAMLTTLQRLPGYRFADFHSYSDAAMQLMLAKPIFNIVNSIFDEPAVAFQSLYFEYGSEQGIHRDPMFVRTEPPSALLAAWIALEDISEGSGPLVYAPCSHRLPYFEFVKGDVIVDKSKDSKADRKAYREKLERDMKEAGIKQQQFTCKKGDVFIWHGNLAHGGAKVKSPSVTRKSFVIHFSTLSSKQSVSNSLVLTKEDGFKKKFIGETNKIIRQDNASAFEAPLLQACKELHTSKKHSLKTFLRKAFRFVRVDSLNPFFIDANE